MTSEVKDALRLQLTRHEGRRKRPYKDTVGKITVGVGRNIDDVEFSDDEIDLMLDNDIKRAIGGCVVAFPWFEGMDAIRQRAIIDLVFNMGIAGFQKFTNTIRFLEQCDYDAAADNLMMSRWFGQVGSRGPRIVHMVRLGTVPPE